MINFKITTQNIYKKCIPNKYPELLKFEVDFNIIINDNIFFSEPNFPIFEFIYFVNKWEIQKHIPFEYISIETNDNPLISFIYKENGWVIKSPWQLFKCDIVFSNIEIINALNELQNQINLILD